MSYNIVYSFIAEDHFSDTLQTIAKRVKEFRDLMDGTNKLTKDFHRNSQTLGRVLKRNTLVINRAAQNFKKYERTTRATNQSLKYFFAQIKRGKLDVKQLADYVTVLGDRFGRKAYFRMLNVALPLAAVVKLGGQFGDSLVRANVTMRTLWGHSSKNLDVFKQISALSNKLASQSSFSRASFMSSASAIAQQTTSIRDAKLLLPDIMRYATMKGVSMEEATKTVMGLMRNMAVTYDAPLGMFYGSTHSKISQFNRLMSNPSFVNAQKKIYDNSMVGQLHTLRSTLEDIAGVLGMQIVPALREVNGWLIKQKPKIEHWLKNHKALLIVIAKIALALVAWVSVLATLSAGFTALGVALGGISKIIKVISVIFAACNLELLPFIAVVGGIATVSYLIYKHWSSIKHTIQAISNDVDRVFDAITHPIQTGHKIIHALEKPANSLDTINPGLSSFENSLQIHIHDKGQNVSHVSHKGQSQVTLHQPYLGIHLGLNMSDL